MTKEMSQEKEIYNVWINQCAECNDLSQVNVRNWDTIQEMEKVEKAIKSKFIATESNWNDDEYYRIDNNSKYKGDNYNGTIELKFRKFNVFATVEFHKCCRCGGNY